MSTSVGINAIIELFKRQRLESAAHVSAVMSTGLGKSLSNLRQHTSALNEKLNGYDGEEMGLIIEELDKITKQLEMFQWDRRNVHSISEVNIHLQEFVGKVFSSLHDRAVRSKVSLLLDIPPEIMVNVDSFRFAQVIMALFENSIQALEATQNRPRWIQVSFHQGKKSMEWVIAISDNGSGIHDDHPDRVFDLFYSTRTDSQAMSLHVAKELCKELGATLRIASTGPTGTVFEVHFGELGIIA